MEYIVDNIYDFEVDYSVDDPDYFSLIVYGPEGPTNISIKKLPFQKAAPYDKPITISCRVKNLDDAGLPVLTPSIASYVRQLYQGTYDRGESFECKVIYVPDNPAAAPYLIEDKNGIFFRINEPKASLTKGQQVNYKFTKLTDRYFNIVRVDDESRIKFFHLYDILSAVGADAQNKRLINFIFENSTDFDAARDEYESGQPSWILTALNSTIKNLPEWFLRPTLTKSGKIYTKLLNTVRNIVLYLLEGSSFLSPATPEVRRVIQAQLTNIADGLEPYDLMLKLIRENTEDFYVQNLLDKLQESGYLYHPARQFAVLILIFRRHPDKVEYYLSRIFESIFGRELENWNREPFKSAFIEQFEIYVRQSRLSVDACPVAEGREQKIALENIIIAIAMQLLLNPESENSNHQWGVFYRYISLLCPLQSEDLLTKSFVSVLGADIHTNFTYSDLRQPMMMITKATVPHEVPLFSKLHSTHRYVNNGIEVSISSKGFTLRPEARHDITDRAIPAGLMTWLNPQIMVNGVRALGGTRIRKLSEHNTWWHDIETSLLEQGITRTNSVETEKVRATIGSQVYIVIDSFSDLATKNPVFNCRISDMEYDDGVGFLKRENIVAYGVRQISMSSFTSPGGNQRGFLATVINIDDQGNYEFSLLDEVNRYAIDNLNYEKEYRAVISVSNERTYAAISEEGVGLLLEHNPNVEVTNGSIVKFKFHNIASEGQRIGYITSLDENGTQFDQGDAFAYLIDNIAVDDDSEEETSDLLRDPDELLTKEDLREIIEIIRFKAIAENELIVAFDYLRFARMLALAIDEKVIAEKLLAHSALLSLHQFFATNNRVDSEKLDSLKEIANSDPFLKMVYHRLELVSLLGHPDKANILYSTLRHPTNNLEADIARMVLAYNLLYVAGEESGITNEIKQKIAAKLNANNENKQGKYYGSESKYLEFKTSIIYRAGQPGEEIKEDPQYQQFHILSRLAGLLNANGGRLYLGVNNDGFEVGLHDDFKYMERHSVFAKVYEFKRVNSLDKLTVFLEELVNQNFERKVSRKIDISIDDEAEKGVIIFNVEQSLEPVFLDGRLFVRQSGQATREYRGSDIEDFVNERESQLAERRRILELENEDKAAASTANNANSAEIVKDTATAELIEETVPTLATSRWKKQILHNYEPGFVDPYGYLYFSDDNSVMFSTVDKYIEPGTDGCTLALAIPQDMCDEVLILGYENEKVLKVPLSNIYSSSENFYSKMNDEGKLLFASIAKNSDGLVCVAADSGNTMSKRMNLISELPNSRLNGKPKRIHDAVMNHTVCYEIADSSSLENFDDCNSAKMQVRRFGMTLRCVENGANADYKLTEIVNACAPQI